MRARTNIRPRREANAWLRHVGNRGISILGVGLIGAVYAATTHGAVLRAGDNVAEILDLQITQLVRLMRLPRLMARYADALDFENPAAAARLDDRSIGDFGRLYFGRAVLEAWVAPRAERSAPGDLHDMSRVQFLIDEQRKGSARVGLPRGSFDEVVEEVSQRLDVRLGTEVKQVLAAGRGSARVDTSAGVLEADAVVLATNAIDAARLSAPVLVAAERKHLAGVRYAPLLTVAAGLCRPTSPRPIYGGKIWCRYWCPLAKWMQITSKWLGSLEISSNDKCITCGECSRYCEVGIDVQSFARDQQAFSNEDTSCIQCGICITVCPMDVLSFDNDKPSRLGRLLRGVPLTVDGREPTRGS